MTATAPRDPALPTMEKTFPLNTAQLRNLRNWSEEELPTKVIAIVLRPAGVGPEAVRRALSQVLARHEALRSRLTPDPATGWLQQVFTPEVAAGSVVEFVSVATAEDVRAQVRAPAPPVPPTRQAVRAVASVHDGAVHLLRVWVSHVFVDAIGARAVENDLRAILATGRPSTRRPGQASAFARGPDHPTVRANTRRWKDLFEDAPRACTYAPAHREHHEPVEHMLLPLTAESAHHLDSARERLRKPMSMVWVALGSALAQLLTGQCRQVFRSTYGNRRRPGDLAAVAQLAQATYVPIDGTPCDTFRDRLDMITRTTLPTYRWSEYDANELLDWLNMPQNCAGTVFQPAFEINYQPPLRGDGADRIEPARPRAYQTRTRIDPRAGKADLALSITHEPGPVLTLSARRPLARQRSAEQLAHDCLDLARSLTEAPDRPLAEVGSITRLPELAGLAQHHSGALVDLAATEKMILSVPGVHDCQLTVVDSAMLHARIAGWVGPQDDLLSHIRQLQCWRTGCVVPDSIDITG